MKCQKIPGQVGLNTFPKLCWSLIKKNCLGITFYPSFWYMQRDIVLTIFLLVLQKVGGGRGTLDHDSVTGEVLTGLSQKKFITFAMTSYLLNLNLRLWCKCSLNLVHSDLKIDLSVLPQTMHIAISIIIALFYFGCLNLWFYWWQHTLCEISTRTFTSIRIWFFRFC